jgi:hypothetical protein
MSELVLLDRAGRRRSPATMPGFHSGRPPRNKGLRYPANPPKIEEIIAVMRRPGTTRLATPAWLDRGPLARRAPYPGSGRPATLRSASAPARPRCRNGPRRRTARRHPAPARPQQPRHQLDLPPRHRQRRAHQHGPRPPRTDDPGQHRTTTLTNTRPRTCSSRIAQVGLSRCSASRAMIRGCCRARSSTWRCWMARQLGGMRFRRST